MDKALTFFFTVLLSFSSFAQQTIIETSKRLEAQQKAMSQQLIDMTKDQSPDIQVIGSNMSQFYLSNKKSTLTDLITNFSGIDNDTIKFVLGDLKSQMDQSSNQIYKKGKGLKAYSKTASNAFLTFTELYYRDEEKNHMDVPDFLFMFDEAGIPFMKKLRTNLGLPQFDNPEICTKVIQAALCKK